MSARSPLRVAVTGHRFFDEAAAAYISDRVGEVLDAAGAEERPVRVVTSLAEGADQLVAQVAIRRGIPVEVIVPAAGYAESLAAEQDRRQYRELVAQADTVRTLEHPAPSPAAYLDAGLAMLAGADRLIAVWDGGPARGVGGSAEIVARARELGLDLQVIWPPGYDRPR
ncbi:MAG TPA: hypothetical protein H9815_15860 [Candidatus Ruania gallistercoris]|uniref:DUF1273 family protein n=1 Tax=Candidatus Ruania gallistercoris TaxID=2838746 RepID=A0A9D2J5C5_9MICO|nr:hypothetical protein [Candidatus Ruania gallistercoris]